jgi:hypothetical protein
MTKIGLFLILIMTGCGVVKKTVDPTVVYSACSLSQESSGVCSRFMDRDVYFVDNSTTYTNDLNIKNNPLDIAKVQESMIEFAGNTDLGSNYFKFHTATEAELAPITGYTVGLNFKSFIQVWPDADFSTLYRQLIPNSNEPNAIVMLNPNNKKQFYMILKGSCFSESNNYNCTNKVGTSFTSSLGLTALVARNLGRIIGISLEDNIKCVAGRIDTNVMCGLFPSDGQWSETEKRNMASLFNNALETISLNVGYYSQVFLETVQ